MLYFLVNAETVRSKNVLDVFSSKWMGHIEQIRGDLNFNAIADNGVLD